MKTIFLLTISYCLTGFLNAQVKQVTTPVIKQTQTVMADINKGKNRPVPVASAIKLATPVTVTENLIFNKWKASRWVENGFWSGYVYAPDFIFFANGTVSCNGSLLSLPNNQLLSGTYKVNGNNITIIIKKDTSEILTSNLVYDNSTKKLNGTYNHQYLSDYAAGSSAQAEMKLEINLQ